MGLRLLTGPLSVDPYNYVVIFTAGIVLAIGATVFAVLGMLDARISLGLLNAGTFVIGIALFKEFRRRWPKEKR